MMMTSPRSDSYRDIRHMFTQAESHSVELMCQCSNSGVGSILLNAATAGHRLYCKNTGVGAEAVI